MLPRNLHLKFESNFERKIHEIEMNRNETICNRYEEHQLNDQQIKFRVCSM